MIEDAMRLDAISLDSSLLNTYSYNSNQYEDVQRSDEVIKHELTNSNNVFISSDFVDRICSLIHSEVSESIYHPVREYDIKKIDCESCKKTLYTLEHFNRTILKKSGTHIIGFGTGALSAYGLLNLFTEYEISSAVGVFIGLTSFSIIRDIITEKKQLVGYNKTHLKNMISNLEVLLESLSLRISTPIDEAIYKLKTLRSKIIEYKENANLLTPEDILDITVSLDTIDKELKGYEDLKLKYTI